MSNRRGRPHPLDVTLGLVVTTAYVGTKVVRVALVPARVVFRAVGTRPTARAVETQLAAVGSDATARTRRALGEVADEAAGGAVVRAVDAALAGPLPEELARSLAEHRVLERMLESGELTERMLARPELDAALERVLTSPAVRAALASQTTSFGHELAAALRTRAGGLDDATTEAVRSRLRRSPAEAGRAYGGMAARALAIAFDLVLLVFGVSVVAATLTLVASLVGDLRPEWLVGVLLASGWLLAANAYFLLFWTTTGQTPGMRLMRLRVVDGRGRPPGVGRSLLRLVGLALAIVPLFAGFLPILADGRRRGLQDLIAGTVVEREP